MSQVWILLGTKILIAREIRNNLSLQIQIVGWQANATTLLNQLYNTPKLLQECPSTLLDLQGVSVLSFVTIPLNLNNGHWAFIKITVRSHLRHVLMYFLNLNKCLKLVGLLWSSGLEHQFSRSWLMRSRVRNSVLANFFLLLCSGKTVFSSSSSVRKNKACRVESGQLITSN